jgi:hypothetical protein
MERTCSKCGSLTPPEARFCRHCGAPLRSVNTFGNNESISPLAQTVPLSSEGLTTSSLGTDEAEGTAAETKRVAHAEMERLLRQSRFEVAPDGRNDGDDATLLNSDYAAPPTGELIEKTPAPAVSSPAPARAVERNASAAARPRRSRALMTGLLLLAALSGAFLAYYFLRQRAPQPAVDVTANGAANSNQAVESINANAEATSAGVVEETAQSNAGPQPEETPQTSPKPGASPEPTRDARAKQEQKAERTTETPMLTPTPTPASPTASPNTTSAQTTPSPQQTTTPPSANSNNSGTQAAQTAKSDDFYFQAVNLVNGRAPRALPRAELLRAIQLFQNVRSGPHAAEARRQAARLGRELDRLNKQSQR